MPTLTPLSGQSSLTPLRFAAYQLPAKPQPLANPAEDTYLSVHENQNLYSHVQTHLDTLWSRCSLNTWEAFRSIAFQKVMDSKTGEEIFLGQLALCQVVEKNDIEKIEDLLLVGISPNWEHSYLPSPLQIASAQGHLDAVQLLLLAKAPINQQSGPLQQTALMAATSQGQGDVVELLLSQGADKTLQNTQQETAKDLAKKYGYSAAASQLGWRGWFSNNIKPFFSPMKTQRLWNAVEGGDLREVRTLLLEGANINSQRETDGWTPLILAASQCGYKQSFRILKTLLIAGASINQTDNEKKPALHHAHTSFYEGMLVLLNAGASTQCYETESFPYLGRVNS